MGRYRSLPADGARPGRRGASNPQTQERAQAEAGGTARRDSRRREWMSATPHSPAEQHEGGRLR